VINLLPPDVKSSIKYGAYNVNIVQYGILLIILGVALAALLLFGVQIVRSDEASLNKAISRKQIQLEEYADDNTKARALTAKISTISKLLEGEVKFSELLQEIGRLLPTGASLMGLQLTTDFSEPLVLAAKVNSKQTATELQQNLANSDLFIGADIQSLAPGDVDEATGRILNYTVNIVVAFADPSSESGGQE